MADTKTEGNVPVSTSIRFDEFTESTMRAVLRALQAQQYPHGPILIGIVIDPQLQQTSSHETSARK